MPTPVLDNRQLGPDTARANLLTNGGFEIWQRGNGPFATSIFAADRWQLVISGTDTLSVARNNNVDTGSSYCAMCTFTLGSGGGNTSLLQQIRIDASDGPNLQGRTVTLSVRVNCNAANAVRIGLNNFYGGTSHLTYSAFHTGNSSYQTLTVIATMDVTATYCQPWIVFAASCTAYIDNAMLVVGSQPADYAPLHPADDLARCLRYYEQPLGPPNGMAVFYLYSYAGGPAGLPLIYHVPKAVTPTVTKTGTWAVANCNQPGIVASSADLASIVVTATSLGGVQFGTNAAGAGLTVEANP